jgi:hypothetical protein
MGRESFRGAMHILKIRWTLKVFVPKLLLVAVPPAPGTVVAYITPPSGLGSRSLSFIVYAICQCVLATIAVAQHAVDDAQAESQTWTASKTLEWLHSGYSFWAILGLWWFGSLVAAIGETTMQITGVYRNCICYAGAESWVGINEKNPPIQIATDTQDKRDSSTY